jgi:hypothetical protein
MDGLVRTLKGIDQVIAGHDELIFNFQYQRVLGDPVLTRFEMGTQKTREFSYVKHESKTLRSYIDTVHYPTNESPSVTYNIDYMAIGCRTNNKRTLNLKIFDGSGQKLIAELEKLSIPPQDPEDTSDNNYFLFANDDSLTVLVFGQYNHEVYMYRRQEKDWITRPTTYNFSKDAKIQFDRNFIALLEPSKRYITVVQVLHVVISLAAN